MSDNERSGPMGDDDLSLPKGELFPILSLACTKRFVTIATVQKLINEMMPDDIICSKDTRDLLIDCCVGKLVIIRRKKKRKELLKTYSIDRVYSLDCL
jgi:hypothetical protein